MAYAKKRGDWSHSRNLLPFAYVVSVTVIVVTLSSRFQAICTPPALHLPFELRRTKALLISFHYGTINDFRHVADSLDFDLTVSRSLTGYTVTRDAALEVWETLGPLYCNEYDWIVIADTVPAGGRPFFEGLGLSKDAHRSCKARVVPLITNRYDFANEYDASYHRAVQRAVDVGAVSFLQNNPYEEYYALARRSVKLTGIRTIRPHGILPHNASFHASSNVPDASLPVVVDKYGGHVLAEYIQEELGIDVVMVGRYYGGPRALARYKCIIHIPYQVSIMAFYENLAAGAVYMVPSSNLLLKLARNTTFQSVETFNNSIASLFPGNGEIVDMEPPVEQQQHGEDDVEDYSGYYYQHGIGSSSSSSSSSSSEDGSYSSPAPNEKNPYDAAAGAESSGDGDGSAVENYNARRLMEAAEDAAEEASSSTSAPPPPAAERRRRSEHHRHNRVDNDDRQHGGGGEGGGDDAYHYPSEVEAQLAAQREREATEAQFYMPEARQRPFEQVDRRFPWHLTEWYGDYFSELVLKFDSWEELRELLKTVDFEKQRRKVRAFMKKHQNDTMHQWAEFFGVNLPLQPRRHAYSSSSSS